MMGDNLMTVPMPVNDKPANTVRLVQLTSETLVEVEACLAAIFRDLTGCDIGPQEKHADPQNLTDALVANLEDSRKVCEMARAIYDRMFG